MLAPMPTHLVPMLHVPDVPAAMRWYASIGFAIRAVHEEPGCAVDWASLTLDGCEVMLASGGAANAAPRRGADLYLRVSGVAEWFARIAGTADVVEGVHETFYGTREFIIRDPNGFWLIFGEPLAG
jgi:uncharacterized glyoxalase superfamily protein PhnB